MSEYRHRVTSLVDKERQRQEDKWGVQLHDDLKWLAILSEEVGEVAQAILKVGGEDPEGWLEPDIQGEIIQVAAIAVAWLESRARQGRD